MSGVQRLEPGEFLQVRFNALGQAQQNPPAIGRAGATPGGKCCACRGDRTVDVGLAGHRDIRNGRIVMRIDRGQGLPTRRVDEFATNE